MWDQHSGPLYATAVAGGLVILSLLRKNKKAITASNGATWDKQSIEVEGEPGTYKCGFLTESNVLTKDTAYAEMKTLYDVFLRGIDFSENGACLGHRTGEGPYSFITYSDVFRYGRDFGASLIGKLGLKAGNSTHVGIYAKNSPEWFISTLGCIQQSIVVVPLYDTLGADAANFIVQQTEIEVIVVDTVDKVNKLLQKVDAIPTLKHIVVIEAIGADSLPKFDKVEIHTFADIINDGQHNPQKMTLPTGDDTYIICYTSGTTGVPKGVVLTHSNLVANLSAFELLILNFTMKPLNKNDSIISYLPLSHMFEQMCHWVMIMRGARIGYFRGNINGLTNDMQELKPVLFPVVPRLLNRFYDAIQANLKKTGFVGRTMYNLAYSRKLALLKKGIVTNDSIWDKLVFKKIQSQVGGNVRLMAVGSAPVSAEVLETCRIALGAIIIEGYGQTECTALATSTWPGDFIGGHTGGPSACSLLKLVDVPELNYYSKDGKGEILIKGPSVTKGYYKDPVKTAELIDSQGWLHTGDIGYLQANGTLKIIDRKKHIFKLAQGEYVAPEKIENVYTRAGVVQQIYVDGDSLQRWLIAIVVPEVKPLMEWNKQHGIKGRTFKQICEDTKAAEYVLSQLIAIGKENKLNSIEQVKKVHLEADPFSVENGLLTPTLKAKRPQIRHKYKDVIAKIYADNANL